MNDSIPDSPEEIMALQKRPLNEELIATAIAGVVKVARKQGQTLDDLNKEVLRDRGVLDRAQRRWLSELVTCAWKEIPL
ncbi:hypothetical protein [Spirulina sp. 06S082]|uniref:hypothetical protein n=1 Tax=Spirulina sp. 06S082 TaxID=3110248 RepID=UPI002B1EAAEC|nr:hypothetical protein [Spirulina sp. 06S082]MEA5468394.1 hypothetical protein [Spirulina sp. 06S082]